MMSSRLHHECQVWRQCYDGRGWAFLCPNGTIFSQELLTCVWWFDFDCGEAEQLYSVNAALYSAEEPDTAGGPETAARRHQPSNTTYSVI